MLMHPDLTQDDFAVRSLGPCLYRSPVHGGFVDDRARILYQVETDEGAEASENLLLEKSGPRERIFFDPEQTTAAIVTCGGLSPGLNNVIRSVYYSLHYNYNLSQVLGIRYGYSGMNPESGLSVVELNHDFVEDIDKLGGTVLGSSRGPQAPDAMIEFLLARGINMLFCVGGDGTQRGAHALCDEISKRELPIAVIGIPKTIDNDIAFVRLSFGYATALERANEVIKGAHIEARSAINGIGLVKLMGRDAGFIAAGATLASQEVNFTLIPEVCFPLEGASSFLDVLENRIRKRGHAVVVVAEGAGQHLFHDQSPADRDASGNLQHHDIGLFLKHRIQEHFDVRRLPITLKYLDPSYYIRSAPANTFDRILSDQMGRFAVDAAMAGKTDMLIGHRHDHFVNVPIATAIRHKKQLDIRGDTWESVLRETRQPRW